MLTGEILMKNIRAFTCMFKHVIEIKISYTEVEPGLSLQENCVFPAHFFQTFSSFLVFIEQG